MQYALFYIDFFVNNIQKNHHLTALNGDFIIVCVTFLIMPFIGLSPFLHSLAMDIMTSVCCVNALYRAFSISTYCPRCGSFNDHYECQCPLSGFFHFYVFQDKYKLEYGKIESMPFIGLLPFLRSPLGTP